MMSGNQLGNGIRKSSARPIKVLVAANGEVWLCDDDANLSDGFAAAGCSSLSESPHNE